MKICKIYIKNFEQFQDVELDFTNPETGEPLDKICFIGSNGTGKSKLLRMINWLFTSVTTSFLNPEYGTPNLVEGAKIIFKLLHHNTRFLIFHFNRNSFILNIGDYTKEEEAKLISELFSLKKANDFNNIYNYKKLTESTFSTDFLKEFLFQDNAKDLLIYSPAETELMYLMGKDGVPESSVDEALQLSSDFPFYSVVSPDRVKVFWKLLIYNLQRRKEEKDKFEDLPENRQKTKDVLIKEFDSKNPKILEHLAKVWDKILNKAGLEFDVKGASNPYQLTDNLIAYIRLLSTKQIIPYNNLSTGIKNFIFRLGHIYSLYFNREINRGFLLIDEPENSLFPDFLFDLVETYNQVLVDKRGQNNTQLFFATHNPIIAAQFQPYERIILDWNQDGFVSVHRGISPIGDDPNDILTNDFELTDLMGPEGREQLKKYVELKGKLAKASAKEDKFKLASEINKIGDLYNFSE
ncbi:AAA family ATPase [Ferruginibacter sp. SUN106]|uniref:AAA family ATPase n=1 Tax=Ferruginibacter sp. SUN106 TaxID=2978348 RepID=UPI003D36D313